MIKSEGLLLKMKSLFSKLKLQGSQTDNNTSCLKESSSESVLSYDIDSSGDHENEPDTKGSSWLSCQTVEEQLKIYLRGKGDNAKLTNLQLEVNWAASAICTESNGNLWQVKIKTLCWREGEENLCFPKEIWIKISIQWQLSNAKEIACQH